MGSAASSGGLYQIHVQFCQFCIMIFVVLEQKAILASPLQDPFLCISLDLGSVFCSCAYVICGFNSYPLFSVFIENQLLHCVDQVSLELHSIVFPSPPAIKRQFYSFVDEIFWIRTYPALGERQYA